MVANILYSDRLNATWVNCHLVAFNPSGNYQLCSPFSILLLAVPVAVPVAVPARGSPVL